MAEPTPETPNFGFTRVNRGEGLQKNGYAPLDLDRLTLDYLLKAMVDHEHSAEGRLADPTNAPTAAAQTILGTLPAGQTFYYKISYLDEHGLETAASPETSATTAAPIAAPNAPSAFVETSGGTLPIGTYSYAITYVDANGNETLASGATLIQVTSGSTNRVRLELPALVAGALSYKIYRAKPGQSRVYFLDTTNTSPYYDDGSVSEQVTITAPRFNTTNSTNSVDVTVPGGTLGADVFGWNIYRSSRPGEYGGNSLVKSVVETTTATSGVLLTTWTDDGSTLRKGFPRKVSSTLGGGKIVSLNQVAGSLPLSTMPRGSRTWSSFLPGVLADSTVYNKTYLNTDVNPTAITAHFLTPPTGADGSNKIQITVTDAAATPGVVLLEVDDNGAYHSRTWPLVASAQYEAENGTRSNEGTIPIIADSTASNQQSVELNGQNEYIEIDLGVMDSGTYTAYTSIRASTGSATPANDIKFDVLDGLDSVIQTVSETAVDGPYTEYVAPSWTADGDTQYKLRVTKAQATAGTMLVDTFRWEADVVTLSQGDVELSVVVVGSPSTNGSDVNVTLWF